MMEHVKNIIGIMLVFAYLYAIGSISMWLVGG